MPKELTQVLIENRKWQDFNSHLHKGHTDSARKMVEDGFDFESHIPDDFFSHHFNSILGNKENMRFIADYGGKSTREQLLIFLLKRNNLPEAKNILKEGDSVNVTCRSSKKSPLMVACSNADYDACEWLLKKKGADPNYVASTETHRSSVNQCINTDKENTAQSIRIIDLLIEHGLDVNMGGPYGVTALYFAASNVNFELTNKLLDVGAKFDKRLIEMIRTNKRHEEIIGFMLKKKKLLIVEKKLEKRTISKRRMRAL